MSTPYLPPGWTEETLKTATPEQWDALTEEEYRKVCERQREESRAITAANKAANKSYAAAMGITLPEVRLAEFVRVIRGFQFQEWGFVVVRATYGNEEQWTQFRKLWSDAIDDQMTPRHGAGIDEVRENLTFQWVEDQTALDGKDMNEIRSYIQHWLTENELPAGQDHNVCLVVTAEAMQSQLNSPTSGTVNYANPQNAPHVIALEIHPEDELEEGYIGQFKVAISSVIEEFFPSIAGDALTMEELAPSNQEAIWFSPYQPH